MSNEQSMIHPQRIEPKPGQESVWDYPRPPRLEQSSKHIEIIFRVLETSHPPSYYIPPDDIQMEYLELVPTGRSFCEWKGLAGYYNVRVKDQQVINAAWYYPQPTIDFLPIQNYVAFYPGKMDACYVDGELVKGQAGGFYGGWITQDIVGPFKGEAGTRGW